MRNLDYFTDNLDQQIIKAAAGDEDVLKQEVKEYMKASKNYKKQYKENIDKLQSNSKYKQPYQEE